MFSWFSKFLEHPLRVGAVAPSSPALGRLMTREIPANAHVLEIGPGSGAITPFILKKLTSPAQLTLMEIDHDFAESCRKRFPETDVIEGDVADLLPRFVGQFDVIVSGVPFGAMEKSHAESVFRMIRESLKPEGRFIMFQYSVRTLAEVRRVFEQTDVRFTPWNLPPAFVFVATKRNAPR